ncbi:hypothetical protein E4K72_03565 [Oxalobacteraceae bacterium OM1]|nr:hypothetical protein E4K72_03565 [Oxalobacteraceae bacterium OM1]
MNPHIVPLFHRRERGSIVAIVVLSLAALGLLGGLAFRAFDQITRSGQRLGLRAASDSAVEQAARSLAVEASDVDGDGIVEAPAMLAGAVAPAGGGKIPLSSGAPKVDAFGTALGYCSWDNGPAGKNTSSNRLTGDSDTSTAPLLSMNSVVFAVISAGRNRIFDTSCAQARTGSAGDDVVVRVTAAEVVNGNGGSVFFGAPTSASGKGTLDGKALVDGEIRLETDTNALVRWDSTTGTWVAMGGGSTGTSTSSGMRNTLINGNFDIWQRGVSGNCNYSQCYTADRWLVNGSASASGAASTGNAGTAFASVAAHSWAQSSVMPGEGPSAPATALTVTRTALASDPAAKLEVLTQRIEDARTLAGRSVTASFWIKAEGVSATTKKFCYDLYQYYGATSSPRGLSVGANCYDLTVGPKWKQVSFSVALPIVDESKLTTDNALWFRPVMEPPGSTAPRDNSFRVTIAQAQLEVGALATVFDRRPLAMELTLAQRFYETGTMMSHARGFSTLPCCLQRQTLNFAVAYYKVPKRVAVTPTVTPISNSGFCASGTSTVQSISDASFRTWRYGEMSWNGSRCNWTDSWVADAEYWQ